MSDDASNKKRKADGAPLSGEESFSFSREEFMEMRKHMQDLNEGRYVTKEVFDAEAKDKRENYVRKEQFDAAAKDKRENYVRKEQFDAAAKDKRENYVRKEQFDVLTGRMNLLVKSMGPAILYARFEAAIYQFVKPCIPEDWKSPEDVDTICHTVASICSKVLDELVKTKQDDEEEEAVKNITFAWLGPTTQARRARKQNREPFPKGNLFPLTAAGLKGLQTFVKAHSKGAMDDLSSKQRNKLVHDGKFLKSILGSPEDSDKTGTEFQEQKEDWKGYQTALSRAESASIASSFDDFGGYIAALVQSLKDKGITVEEEQSNDVVTALNKMAFS